MAKINILNDLLKDKELNKSRIADRLIKADETPERKLRPNFPRVIQVETTNICNHGCVFCAYTKMERPKRHIDKEMFIKIIKDCYDLGSREIGLFSGAEPMTCKWLDEYVKICKEIGYTYSYISSNGALGNTDKYLKVINAGLDSIKFSVNGGNREIYKKIHGKDDFEKVINNIKAINKFRKENKKKLWLGISFVATDVSRNSFEELKKIIEEDVDEIIMYEANNQSGQVDAFPIEENRKDCSLPFAKAHFTAEGYMRACCNDYENYLAIEDINKIEISKAWNGKKFQELREKHINDKLDGTLCGKCIRNSKNKISPLNKDLVTS